MKQRTTYVFPEEYDLDVKQIHIGSDSLEISNASEAAVESRYTFGLSSLPDELRTIASGIHELHIRWSSQKPYEARMPLITHTPPGLHVFYTPRDPSARPNLCHLLHALFSKSLKCSSTEEAFSSPPVLSERFASSSTYQYYSILPYIDQLEEYAWTHLFSHLRDDGMLYEACAVGAKAISKADYIDIDFDVISHAVTLTAYWSPTSNAVNLRKSKTAGLKYGDGQSALIKRSRLEDSVEVGVLQPQKPDEPEELALGGYLTVLDQDTKPSTTLFSFPSRHHPSKRSQPYTPHFLSPTGLHPNLALTFPSPPRAPHPSCALHAYLTLPSALFLDRYALGDSLTLASHNLKNLHTLSGAQDLEAPDWAVPQWGSAALFELAAAASSSQNPDSEQQEQQRKGEWTATIPLHLRYVAPSNSSDKENGPGSSHQTVQLPHPLLFYACPAEEGLKFATNPFDRTNLGFDALFGPKTMFYHLESRPSAGGEGLWVENVQVPVLDLRSGGVFSEEVVRWGTMGVVVLGFLWVLWKLVGPLPRREGERGKKVQ